MVSTNPYFLFSLHLVAGSSTSGVLLLLSSFTLSILITIIIGIYLGGFRVKGFIIGVHNGILQKKVSSEYLRNPRIPLLTGILGFLRYSQNTRFLKILINIEFINLPSF